MLQDDEISGSDVHWYAVGTRSRQEKTAAAILDTLSIRYYLPLKSELRQWSDRKQLVKVPLFAGYIFVNISLLKAHRLQVLNIPGVVSFIGNHSGPSPIPDKQIHAIRTILDAGLDCAVQPLFEEGDSVRVVRGPLAGVEGTLERSSSRCRLVISVGLIHQSVSLNVMREDVELVTTVEASVAIQPVSNVPNERPRKP